MYDVSIIIVNHKSRGLVRNCLRSLAQDLEHSSLSTHVAVVNSGEDEETRDMVVDQFPHVRLVQKSNNGYSSAVNAGIAHASAKYYFILNPDIMLLEGSIIDRLYAFMEKEATVGMAMPKLINPDGSVQLSPRTFPHFTIPLYSRTALGKLPFAKKAMRDFLMIDWDHQATRDIDWALGSAFFVRHVALKDAGVMDTRYFLYVEDTDWCRSFWQNDWRVTYVGNIGVVHYHMRSSATQRGLRGLFNPLARQHIKSWVQYFAKFRNQSPNPHKIYEQEKQGS